MPSICQLFYVSRSTHPLDNAAVQAILQIARRNNTRLDVTGCLLYSGRYFAQVLEGDDSVVAALSERIAADPRHEALRVLMQRQRVEREFRDWSMGYLHDLGLEDDLAALLQSRDGDSTAISSVLGKFKVDSVMGALS